MTDRRTFIRNSLLGVPILNLAAEAAIERIVKPIVVSTWDSGIRANAAAWPTLAAGGRALDAVEKAGIAAEIEPSCCVGLAALPDRDGFVTLDACIMDEYANIGAVSFLERIKHPVSVARAVMERTPHVLLSGEGAQSFAIENGFKLEPAGLSAESEKAWKEWLKESKYQPRMNIENMQLRSSSVKPPYYFQDGTPNHDTMGTIAMDARGNLSGMVTTSGMAYKMRGRVGDSPIIGAGLYVDNKVGAATSSGVGEEVIRVCGTHTVIEEMRRGRSPKAACREAVLRIVERDPEKARSLQVGFVAIARSGLVGAFAIQKGFSYSVMTANSNKTIASASYFK
ncbi:MAG: N(4)-(beta-N-acetylglucosaminyl)-L-asparaginase [Pyrinomonadaceae bacterium]|nr:N(4)-(beta-N-acetylglucosaminyl)-L-asparaginase [Pyrinomonadaceae bacterium]